MQEKPISNSKNETPEEKVFSESSSPAAASTSGEPPSKSIEREEALIKKSKRKRIWTEVTRLEELEKKAHQSQFYLDQLQRLQAEFENYRKRSLKDKEEFRKFVLEDFIIELLDIADNFQRAMDATRVMPNTEGLQSGIEMIYRQFWDCLVRKGVSEISSVGQPFDPFKHEAVAYEETSEYPPHQVLSEMAKGYHLHGKIIRPSKVKISKESVPSESSTPESSETCS